MSDKEEQKITITMKLYGSLCASERKLIALEGAGVDNWEGFDDAMEFMDQEIPI